MHLLSALFLASNLLGGDKKEKKPFNGFLNIIEVKHYLPGRIRFYIPIIKSNTTDQEVLKSQLAKIEAISSFEVTPISGSVLVHFDETKLPADILFGAIVQLLGLELEINKEPKSILGNQLTNFESAFNRSLFEKSKGVLDIKSLLNASFLILGIGGILAGKVTSPNPISMLYWGINGISRLNKP